MFQYLKTVDGVVNGDIQDAFDAGILSSGKTLQTAVYYEGSQYGGCTYQVVASGTSTDDGGLYIDFTGFQLKAIFGSRVDVTQFGAVPSNPTHHDTTAVQKAINAACLVGGAEVYVPPGDYYCRWQDPDSGWQPMLIIWADDVVLTGPGRIVEADVSTIAVASRAVWLNGSLASTYSATHAGLLDTWYAGHTAGWSHNSTVYSVVGSLSTGDAQVVLASAGDLPNFSVGDYILIRTGQLVSTLDDAQPDSELNQIESMIGTTLNLKWGLAKPYEQENYITGSSGLTEVGGVGNSAPYGIANITGQVIRNVGVDGVSFLTPTAQAVGLSFNTVKSCFKDMKATALQGGFSGRDNRFWTVECNQITSVGTDDSTDAYWGFAPSTGCTDIEHQDNTYSGALLATLHISEGVANMRSVGNIWSSPYAPTLANGILGLNSRCYNFKSLDDTVHGRTSATQVVIGDLCTQGGSIHGLTVEDPQGYGGGNTISCGGSGWSIIGCRVPGAIVDTGSGNLIQLNL